MPRKTAKTDILVDRFYPVHFIQELSSKASERTRQDSKKRYKSLTVSLDTLNASKLSNALGNVVSQLTELNDKVTLTIFVDEESTYRKLRMTVTADRY